MGWPIVSATKCQNSDIASASFSPKVDMQIGMRSAVLPDSVPAVKAEAWRETVNIAGTKGWRMAIYSVEEYGKVKRIVNTVKTALKKLSAEVIDKCDSGLRLVE